jgi:hypothetical protein
MPKQFHEYMLVEGHALHYLVWKNSFFDGVKKSKGTGISAS